MGPRLEDNRGFAWRGALLAAAVAAVYANILGHGFVWDDLDLIVHNRLLENLGNIPLFFLSEDRVGGATGYYRPMTYVSFALDRAVWGMNPLGFNLTNLALHIAVSLLLFAVVNLLFCRREVAFTAAAIFALHPLAGETVNFHAGGRNTLLSASFALVSLLLYLRERRTAALLPFTIAIFSKEFALLLPAVFLAVDLRIRRMPFRPGRYLPFLAPIVLYLALRAASVESPNLLRTLNLSSQLWLTPYLVLRYLINMVFPFRLKVLYDEGTTLTVCILSLLFLIILTAAVMKLAKRGEVVLGWFWFLLFLLPVANIIRLSSPTLIADRYGYFALLGFALAAAGLLCRGNGRRTAAALLLLCSVYGLLVFRQNDSWKSETSLYTRMTRDAPDMFLGYGSLGRLHYARGEMEMAEKYLAAACDKADVPPSFLREAASMFLDRGKPAQAKGLLLRGLELQPENPETYMLLKKLAEMEENQPAAAGYLESARQRVPGFSTETARMASAHAAEGVLLLERGELNLARNILGRALAVQPEYVPALVSLGELECRIGNTAAAAELFRKALRLDPENGRASKGLRLVEMTLSRQ